MRGLVRCQSWFKEELNIHIYRPPRVLNELIIRCKLGQYLLQYQLQFYWHICIFMNGNHSYYWQYSTTHRVGKYQRRPGSDIIQKWSGQDTSNWFCSLHKFSCEIKMNEVKGGHLLSHKRVPKNCQIVHLLTFMARICSFGHTYLQERLGTVAFIKFPCMEERDHRYWGDLAASTQPWSMVIAALFLIADGWRQLKIHQILWYVHTMKYHITIKGKELCKYRCKDL